MPQTHFRQHGAVLVVSLLILLVLTIIGLSGLRASVMEERMASNNQNLTKTFQAAESAVQSTFIKYQPEPDTLVTTSRYGAASDKHFDHNLGDNTVSSSDASYIGEGLGNGDSIGNPNFASYNIEVTGTSTINNTNITSTVVQGYQVRMTRSE
jgi:type IV pilus assembly protein PilX